PAPPAPPVPPVPPAPPVPPMESTAPSSVGFASGLSPASMAQFPMRRQRRYSSTSVPSISPPQALSMKNTQPRPVCLRMSSLQSLEGAPVHRLQRNRNELELFVIVGREREPRRNGRLSARLRPDGHSGEEASDLLSERRARVWA